MHIFAVLGRVLAHVHHCASFTADSLLPGCFRVAADTVNAQDMHSSSHKDGPIGFTRAARFGKVLVC